MVLKVGEKVGVTLVDDGCTDGPLEDMSPHHSDPMFQDHKSLGLLFECVL